MPAFAVGTSIAVLGASRSCLPAEMLVVELKSGIARGRGRVAEPQIDIDARQRRLIRYAGAANIDDMRTLFDARAVEHGDGGIRAGRDDVRAFVNLLGPRTGLGFDAIGLGRLAREGLAMGRGRAEHIEPLDLACL